MTACDVMSHHVHMRVAPSRSGPRERDGDMGTWRGWVVLSVGLSPIRAPYTHGHMHHEQQNLAASHRPPVHMPQPDRLAAETLFSYIIQLFMS